MRKLTGSASAARVGRGLALGGRARVRPGEYRSARSRLSSRTPENEAWRLQLARGAR